MTEAYRVVETQALRTAVFAGLMEAGVDEEHAAIVADGLITASRNGIDTHGVELLPTYFDELLCGRSKARPSMKVEHPRPALTVVDADCALGIVGGTHGMSFAIESAKACGVGVSLVTNSNHFGAAGLYSEMASDSGMIGMAFSNSDALVAAHNGTVALNGTNPIAFAAPAGDGQSFALDMATSQTSYSKARKTVDAIKSLPEGWAIDNAGFDAAGKSEFVALKPLGGYKGQGLAVMVQILTAILGRMPFDHQLTHLFSDSCDGPRKISHLFVCINIGDFLPLHVFQQRLSELITHQRASPCINEAAVIVAGDTERVCRKIRDQSGIPISKVLFLRIASHLAAAARQG